MPGKDVLYMELNEKNVEPMCPIIDIDGYIANGKQYDLDITLANDNRDVIYGIVRDCFKDPVKDAVVKLVEVDYNCGKKELKPVTHTFTDKYGQFVFGPLCANKFYEIEIWANRVKHSKICTTSKHHGKCLKGEKLDCDCNEYFDKREEDVEE